MFGHIKIDRKILKWEWYQDSKMVHLFLHLLLTANHADGSWQGIKIKRGQLITGRLKLAADVSLSQMQVRTCLDKLKSTKEITIKVTNRFSIITICKYDSYQSSKNESNQQKVGDITVETANEQPTSNQPDNHKQEDKNDNKNKEDKKESNTPEKNLLKNSNMFRQPTIPKFEEVQRVFFQNGGSDEMAKKFFSSNESVGWFRNNTPITNFSNLVPSYIDTWNKNSKNGKHSPSTVGKEMVHDSI